MIGMLTGQVLPITVGMLGGRPVALSLSRSVSLRQSALSVFVDKLFDLILALLLVLPVALFLANGISLTVAFVLMASTVIVGAIADWPAVWCDPTPGGPDRLSPGPSPGPGADHRPQIRP